jgi:pimeloyl-ACP methyl ester carboxylesterase
MTPLPLPEGISSRMVRGINGLDIHVLEAGDPSHPCLLLLHGFPELAFSWRKVMGPLAALGYHVVAPDQRGYGRTTGWDDRYEADLAPFRLFNLVRDQLGLLHALGHAHVAAVIGHDFGSPVAAWCALLRPDVFRAVALMSSPFAGPPSIGRPAPGRDIHADLAGLARPRRHYQWYYSTPGANADMVGAPQGLHAFLRAYYHHKSADWAGNRPYRLGGWTAAELAKLPTYYVMDLAETMAQTVDHEMPGPAEIAANRWLPEADLAVYAAEYARTGFQGGLQWYRCRTTGRFEAELELFSGRGIAVPSCFVSGASDWGIEQSPGALEAMQGGGCRDMRFVALVPGAGHWVQQEQPAAVVAELRRFLGAL